MRVIVLLEHTVLAWYTVAESESPAAVQAVRSAVGAYAREYFVPGLRKRKDTCVRRSTFAVI